MNKWPRPAGSAEGDGWVVLRQSAIDGEKRFPDTISCAASKCEMVFYSFTHQLDQASKALIIKQHLKTRVLNVQLYLKNRNRESLWSRALTLFIRRFSQSDTNSSMRTITARALCRQATFGYPTSVTGAFQDSV